MSKTMKEYLGDGVYVEWDGYALVFTTENGISVTNQIVLEPEVWGALQRFVTRIARETSGPWPPPSDLAAWTRIIVGAPPSAPPAREARLDVWHGVRNADCLGPQVAEGAPPTTGEAAACGTCEGRQRVPIPGCSTCGGVGVVDITNGLAPCSCLHRCPTCRGTGRRPGGTP